MEDDCKLGRHQWPLLVHTAQGLFFHHPLPCVCLNRRNFSKSSDYLLKNKLMTTKTSSPSLKKKKNQAGCLEVAMFAAAQSANTLMNPSFRGNAAQLVAMHKISESSTWHGGDQITCRRSFAQHKHFSDEKLWRRASVLCVGIRECGRQQPGQTWDECRQPTRRRPHFVCRRRRNFYLSAAKGLVVLESVTAASATKRCRKQLFIDAERSYFFGLQRKILGGKKLKLLVFAKKQHFKFGSRLILIKTFLAVSAFLQS